jgi:hypothetical protein
MGGTRKFHVLADQEDIDRAQIEFVKEGQGREALFGRMHTSIKLYWEYVSEQSEIRILNSHTMTVLPLYWII